MLKEHSQFFQALFFLGDMVVISAAWIFAYYLRFSTDLVPVTKGVPPLSNYLPLTLFVWIIWGSVFRYFGLYRPMRGARRSKEIIKIFQASSFATLLFTAIAFLFWEKRYSFSRLVFIYFWLLGILLLVGGRWLLRELLGYMRRRGYNLRHILIVGCEDLAHGVVHRIHQHPELGLVVRGYLARDKDRVGRICEGVPVIGQYPDISRILAGGGIDQVLFALPFSDLSHMESLLRMIGPSTLDIKVIPDIFKFISLRSGVEDFDGLPVISLLDIPLQGWNRVIKRTADLVMASAALVGVSPLLLIIAALIKFTSPGPVFYGQERMGLDGQIFRLWKFRTMKEGAEEGTGPMWAVPNDPRRTWVGRWLRRWSLDELPQLINVMRGEMSLVGPRPERVVFIEEFKKKIPRYMLRHKVKAGMTGWAQIHGWRGNTDLGERIVYDLYYIENWSFLLDLKILFLTMMKGFLNKNAY